MPVKEKKSGGAKRELFTRNFLLISVINLTVFFGYQMTAIGLPVYAATLGAGAQVVGLVTTLVTVSALIVRAFSGALLDRFGRKGSLIAGIALMLCTTVAYAVFPIVGVILGLRLLHGIGWGPGSTTTNTIAADIIPKPRFAEGMGYFAMTTAVAIALAPALSIQLVQGSGALYMIVVSAACTAVALVLSFFQSDPANKTVEEHEEQDGSYATSGIDHFVERRALLPSAIMFLVNMGFGCIVTFIALHAQEQGVENISLYFLVYAIVTIVSRPGIGKLIDRYGYRVPGILSTLCTSATLVMIGLSDSLWMFALAGVLAGLGLGTAGGTFQAMAVAASKPWRRGVATSTYLTAFDLGIAMGSLVGGIIATSFGYSVMYLAIAFFPLAGCIVSAFAVRGAVSKR